MKPFLKWAGNKYHIINVLKQHFPQAQRLVEPFAGSLAIFLNTEYRRYYLAEANSDLVNLYHVLETEGERFIRYSRRYFKPETNQKHTYYQLRETFNHTTEPRRRAALFLYLNKHGYNGLCRYNRSGIYNVPFGLFKKPYFPEKEMRFFLSKAHQANIVNADFLTTFKRVKPGDLVYCDPPYVPLSKTASFSTYQPGGFSEQRQIELSEQAIALAEKNIPVVISNHDTPFTRELYRDATIIDLKVMRSISCKSNNRQWAPEIIAVF